MISREAANSNYTILGIAISVLESTIKCTSGEHTDNVLQDLCPFICKVITNVLVCLLENYLQSFYMSDLYQTSDNLYFEFFISLSVCLFIRSL